MSLASKLSEGQVAAEVVVSSAGRVLDVCRMSPIRPYYVGADPKTCDYVISADKLGTDSIALFDVSGGELAVTKDRDRVTVGANEGGEATVTIGDILFTIRWCDDADLRAIWSDVAAITSTKTGLFSESYSYTVTCLVAMPVRTRCPSCGVRLEGRITARAEGSSDETPDKAKDEARTEAIGEVRNEIRLAACPACRHRPGRRVVRFAIECALAVLAVVAVPALFLFGHLRGRIHSSIFLPSVAGAVVLGHRIKTWFGSSHVRLRPERGAKPRLGMGESAAGTAHEAPWKEHVQATDGPRVLSFVGINQDQEDRFEVTRLASASTRKNRHLPGCLAQIVGFVAVFMWFGGRGNSEAAIFNMFFCLFMVAVGGPWVVGLWGWLASTPWKPEQSEVTGEFTLSISREELKLGGPGIDPAKRLAWPLVVIERFDGLQRLTLLRHDGGVESLPCRLPYGTHEGLAARLNAWLVDARETPATQTSQTHPSKKLT